MLVKDKVKHVTNLAFESGDQDKSGVFEAGEVQNLMEKVAMGLGVNAPNLEDVQQILQVLDENSDGTIDKEEFLALIMHGFGNIMVLEEQL